MSGHLDDGRPELRPANEALIIHLGEHLTLGTKDRQHVTGRIAMVADDRVLLITPFGSATVNTGAIRRITKHDIS